MPELRERDSQPRMPTTCRDSPPSPPLTPFIHPPLHHSLPHLLSSWSSKSWSVPLVELKVELPFLFKWFFHMDQYGLTELITHVSDLLLLQTLLCKSPPNFRPLSHAVNLPSSQTEFGKFDRPSSPPSRASVLHCVHLKLIQLAPKNLIPLTMEPWKSFNFRNQSAALIFNLQAFSKVFFNCTASDLLHCLSALWLFPTGPEGSIY